MRISSGCFAFILASLLSAQPVYRDSSGRVIEPTHVPPLLPSEETPVFRTATQLVQVDVVVKAKSKPVENLTKDDFEIYDEDKPQQIAVFSVHEQKVASSQPRTPLPAGVVTNRPANRGPEPVSATILLLDSQNTHPEDLARARLQALKYLDNASRDELLAVYQLDMNLVVLQSLTDDKNLVREAIKKFKAPASGNLADFESDNGELSMVALERRARITTKAFNTLARNLEGTPGRKKLVWISAALPPAITDHSDRAHVKITTDPGENSKAYNSPMRPLARIYVTDIIEAPIPALNAANIVLYAVDARGVMTISQGGGLSDPNIGTMIKLASATGGTAFYNSNDIAQGIEEAASDTDVTYTLGFYAVGGIQKDLNHKLRVKLKKEIRNIDLRYRSTYKADEAPRTYTSEVRTATMNAWVQEPIDPTAIPIVVNSLPSPKKGHFLVSVIVDISALQLEMKKGRHVGNFELAIVPDTEKKPKGLRQTFALNLTDEQYQKALTTGMGVVNNVRGIADDGNPLAKQFHVVVMDNTTMKAGGVRVPIESGTASDAALPATH